MQTCHCRRRACVLQHAPTRAPQVHPTCPALFPSAPPCSLAERAGQLVGAATQAGALDFLKTGVLDSVPMQVDIIRLGQEDGCKPPSCHALHCTLGSSCL